MFLESPLCHLIKAKGSEDPREVNVGHDGKPHPSEHFKSVVGAHDVLKQEAARDFALLGAWWSKVGQHDVADKISNFAKDKDGKPDLHTHVRGNEVLEPRVCQWVPDSRTKGPVVSTVDEQLLDGHCGVRESMHKVALEFALKEVGRPAQDSRLGHGVEFFTQLPLHLSRVKESGTRAPEQHKRQGTEVLHQKHEGVVHLQDRVVDRGEYFWKEEGKEPTSNESVSDLYIGHCQNGELVMSYIPAGQDP